MKQKNNEQEELIALTRSVHKVGRSVALSKKQKKAMLQSILPHQNFGLTWFKPAVLLPSLTLLLVISSLIVVSKPGSPLYAVKRSLEDARSKVQPSYDDKLIKRRDDEINDIKNNGGSDEAVKKAEKEKQEIEDRIRQRGTEAEKEKQEDNKNKIEEDDSSEIEQENNSANNNDANVSNSSLNTTASGGGSTDKNAARDQCKAALDARKKAGENINSDAYKACDNL